MWSNSDDELFSAINVANEAYYGKLGPGNRPLVEFAVNLMLTLKSNNGKIVALLYAILDETEFTIDDLEGFGFNHTVLNSIYCLKKRKGESKKVYLDRVFQDELAKIVKQKELILMCRYLNGIKKPI